MSRYSTASVLVVITALGSLGTTGAGAFSVYNSSAADIGVMGEQCPGCFMEYIRAGNNGSCPGDEKGCRGETWISWATKAVFETSESHKCPFKGPPQYKGSSFEFSKDFARFGFEFLKGVFDGSLYGPMFYCPHRVPAHGWVTVKGDKGDHCHVKDPGGNLLYDGPAKVNCGVKDD